MLPGVCTTENGAERLAFADLKGRGLFQGREQRNKVAGRRKAGAVVKRGAWEVGPQQQS